jgi:TetR/AcrR family transcriptional regulator
MSRAAAQSGLLRRQQAIDTLLELASELPPSQIRTAQISQRMGLSEAALFRHFPTKESLWFSTLEHAIGFAWREVEKALDGLDDPLDAIYRLLASQFSVNRTLPGMPALIFHELQNREPSLCRVVVINHLERLRKYLLQLLTQAQYKHKLSKQVCCEALADTLLALMLGLLLQEQIRGGCPGESEAQLEISLHQLLTAYC